MDVSLRSSDNFEIIIVHSTRICFGTKSELLFWGRARFPHFNWIDLFENTVIAFLIAWFCTFLPLHPLLTFVAVDRQSLVALDVGAPVHRLPYGVSAPATKGLIHSGNLPLLSFLLNNLWPWATPWLSRLANSSAILFSRESRCVSWTILLTSTVGWMLGASGVAVF